MFFVIKILYFKFEITDQTIKQIFIYMITLDLDVDLHHTSIKKNYYSKQIRENIVSK